MAQRSTRGGTASSLQLSKTPVTVRVLTRASTDGHTRWFKTITPQAFEPAHPTIKVEYDEVSGKLPANVQLAYDGLSCEF